MPDVTMPDRIGDFQAPPKRRIADYTSAQGIALKMDNDDLISASNRRAIDALFDGEVPFDQSAREQMGLGHLANFNSLGAFAKEQNALAAYVELVEAPENIVSFELDTGDEDVDQFAGDVLAQEFHRIHDQWPQFRPNLLMLATQFIRHGVSVAYRKNPWDWRWDVCGWMNFRMERGTRIGPENIKIFKFTDYMYVDELWEKIEDEEAASKAGWDVTAVKMAIAQADTSETTSSGNWTKAWDRFQLRVKENSFYLRSMYGRVTIENLGVKECDGTYSLYVIRREGGTEFLCKQECKYKQINHILTMFMRGVGDGTYHTVRGMGFQTFFQEQALNRTRCGLLDGTDLAGKIVFQPTDPNELENMSMSFVGPFSILNCKGTFPNVAAPNVASQVLPVIQDLEKALAMNTGIYQAVPVGEQSGRDITATEYRGRSVEQTVLGSAQMGLFYDPLEMVMTEDWRRLSNPKLTERDPGGYEAFQFRSRVMKKFSLRGLNFDDMRSKVVRLRCNRAMGNGSPQMRQNASQKLLAVSGYFDEQGKNNAVRDYTATIEGVGWQHVNRYAPKIGPRIPSDAAGIAAAQNAAFGSGVPQPVLPNEILWIHARIHADYLWGVAQALDDNQTPPERAMPILEEGLQHLEQTEQFLEQDKGHQPEANAIRRMLQQSGAIFERWQNHMLAEQRRQQEQPQQQAAPDGKTQLAQQELQHKQEIHNLDVKERTERIRILAEDHAFKLHTEDLLNSQKIGQQRLTDLARNGQ